MDLVYVCGPPAAGKSSLMAALTARCQKSEVLLPFAHQRLVDPRSALIIGWELGKARAEFPGTDALGMNVAPVAKQWVAMMAAAPSRKGLILGEGDRLGFPAFLEVAARARINVTLVHLTADQATLDMRCEQRRSAQNASWRAGRATKAANLAGWAKANGCQLVSASSAVAGPETLAGILRDAVPALEVLP